ncbi:MAG: hypothetical protein SOT67_02310 [Bacteroidaceae bacterium]|nr:hypothetical protein [Prevotellaceae bacterium]MDY2849090.1 hypothetical protein [Bacteroidaceae bacterium]
MATRRDDLLQQLNVKLDMLTQRYDEIKKRQQIADALKEENILLRQKLETLKTAKTLALGKSDIQQAKVNLSRLIRQIDACISLLVVEK